MGERTEEGYCDIEDLAVMIMDYHFMGILCRQEGRQETRGKGGAGANLIV